MMDRKQAFEKICLKIDILPADMLSLISTAQLGDVFFFGRYRIVYDGLHGKKNLPMISLFDGDIIETRIMVESADCK